MADEQVAKAKAILEVVQKIQDLGLNADVKGGDGLVTDQKLGFKGKGAGDSDALALATRKFVGVLKR
jgi:hypothetical protein